MVRERIVLGATGGDAAAREAARRLRDEGLEVVYVGGRQTPEQLVRTAIAEDATALVVDADAEGLSQIADLCEALGIAELVVTLLDDPRAAPRCR
ncbi:hypothetical protein [Aeromicrobium sp. A1-2]|uniref:hypothetical protein n=1 Tax=Aeromicrobium sp. A1-2 TaxID=2107713 RepID=UPI001C1F3B0B|nr:hypothetical protein [Aeromicrobium sp. A1-2]